MRKQVTRAPLPVHIKLPYITLRCDWHSEQADETVMIYTCENFRVVLRSVGQAVMLPNDIINTDVVFFFFMHMLDVPEELWLPY